MNENEIFRLKGRIAISNLSREDKNMIKVIIYHFTLFLSIIPI